MTTTTMTSITCLRGLPGSGKTTVALRLLELSDKGFRSNRDSHRKENFGKTGVLPGEDEVLISINQEAEVRAALKDGRDVYIDDMHLKRAYLTKWNKIANEFDVPFYVHDVETDVDVCVARDSVRERQVGEKVIRDLAEKFTKQGVLPEYRLVSDLPTEANRWEKVEWDPELPHSIIVDLDGTMFHLDSRNPYEVGPRLAYDRHNRAVVNLVNRLLRDGYYVQFFSGRKEAGRSHTLTALRKALVNENWTLDMRANGDNRKDDIVKYEIFNRATRDQYSVKFVLDDRDQVVKMWRAMGLSCFQVAEGNF